jgi:hypothetical protein
MGMEGNHRRQPVGGLRPLEHSPDERLVSPVQPIEGTDGQHRILSQIRPCKIVDYFHFSAMRKTGSRSEAVRGQQKPSWVATALSPRGKS